ncbi:hypothetical protein ACMG4H_12650 [Corynebacterium glutamicum]|uniref:hypothetical protein n=1 Tax=Corynebacterium glutamicum TaxID=1718 RepID=UPI003C799011
MENIHGRDLGTWQDLVSAAVESLQETARIGGKTTYTDLNREISEKTGQPGFDFSSPEGRNAMSDLLGHVVEQTYPEHQAMLSALVMYLNENKPGPGFYHLATTMGILSREASPEEKEAFWFTQYNKAIEACGSPKSRHPRRRNR